MSQRPDTLFSDIPIIGEEEFIHATFINRERELLIAKALFKPEQSKDQIYAVHGFSRVGKSHLAIKIGQDISREHNLFYFYASANLRGTAEDVLRALYDQIREAIQTLTPEPDPKTEQGEHYRFLKEYLAQVNQLFMMPVARIAVRHLQRASEKIKPGFRLKVPFLDIGIDLAGEKASGKDQEQTIELPKLDVNGIRLLLCSLLEMLAFVSGRGVLMLIDDLDLLEETSGGEEQRDQLINHLKQVAALASIAVWVTSRQQYFIERQKEMFNFIEVPFLKREQLVAIYRARIKQYNGGDPVFTDEVLDMLADGFRGIAGSFLYECFLFWRYHLGEPYPLGTTHLRDYLDDAVGSFLANPETRSIFVRIRKAVRARKAEITLKDVKKGHGLIYRVLIPKAYGQNTYEIIPLFARAILEDIG